MSKGSPIVPIRFPAELLDQLDQVIRRSADNRKGEPWTRSSLILQAVRDKLDHMERGRRASRGRKRKLLTELAEGFPPEQLAEDLAGRP